MVVFYYNYILIEKADTIMTRTKCFSFLIFLIMFLIGACASSPTEELLFKGDGGELLILESDIPLSWRLKNVRQDPMLEPNAKNWTVIYNKSPDLFGTNSLIFHSITTFGSSDNAADALNIEYQIRSMLAADITEAIGFPADKLEPPAKYSYISPFVDEFKVLYYPEQVLNGSLVGYRYEVVARYGNVLSIFDTIVEDTEQMGVTADEANVLTWSEVEKLLETIDQRIEEAHSK